MIALIPWLAALAPAPQVPSPALLPETPEDWRYERLEFPLSFAPDIALEGYEELSFAPGMFEAGAPTYWTYVLALDVSAPDGGALEVDAAFLESFLVEYYRGLCGAVWEGREPELDLDAVRAEVSGGGAAFAARIELYDVFVTGEALSLGLELLVHPDPGGGPGVQLLGLASPAATDGPVWAELRSFGAAWRAARPVPVFLNHVYMIPDLATYEALRASEFLREFAVFEERTTERGDTTYTGLYLYGKNTYFEFLKPDPAAGFAPGGTGVAFGVEVPGGLQRVAAALQVEGVPSFADKISRDLEGEQVPWFDILGIQAATTTQRLQLFAMEYDPQFLGRWHRGDGPSSGRIDRGAVLSRYAQVLGGPAEPLFGDVDSVSLNLDEEEHARYLQVTRAFGMGRESDPGFTLDPEAVLDIRTGAGHRLAANRLRELPGGILLFQGRLMRNADWNRHDFGQIELHLDGDRFTLLFKGLPTEEIR